MEATDNKAPIKAYSKSEMIELCNTTKYIFSKWLDECHDSDPEYFPKGKSEHSHMLSPKQVEIIFKKYGWPDKKNDKPEKFT